MEIQVDDLCRKLRPFYNQVILKRAKVTLKVGPLVLPEEENPVMEVIAIGSGVEDGEPCPCKVGDYVMPMPQVCHDMGQGFYCCAWVQLLGCVPKDAFGSIEVVSVIH